MFKLMKARTDASSKQQVDSYNSVDGSVSRSLPMRCITFHKMEHLGYMSLVQE